MAKLTANENPDNQRDVLVYVLTVGWMMGRYLDGVWYVYFSDTGLCPANPTKFCVAWDELPPKPVGIPKLDWYHGEYNGE